MYLHTPLMCFVATSNILNLPSDVSLAVTQLKQSAYGLGLNKWDFLNHTLRGRLHIGRPVSLPCFSTFNGQPITIDQAACAEVETEYTSPTFRTGHFGAYVEPQWETCQSTSEQCLLDTNHPNNSAAWTSFQCSQGSVPPYYIDVREPQDVQVAYAFSLMTGVPLSIKNTGHDFKGRASRRNSLSLWTFNLKSLAYDAKFRPEGGSSESPAITAGAGVGWLDVYEFADRHNVTAIGGYHQTVGASGGWLMGGGHSVLSPVYGLGVDRVLQMKVVTPDGRIRVVNNYQNTDLFWALRGGGGSTFGVVLESTFLVEPRLSLQVASIHFPLTAVNSAPFLKIAVDNALRWGNEGWGGHIGAAYLVNVNPLISLEKAKASMKLVVDYALSQNGTAVVETMPSWLSFFRKYVLPANNIFGIELIIGSRLIPTAKFMTVEDRKEIHDVLLDTNPSATNPYIILGAPHLYKHTPGATSVTPAWRRALWHIVAISSWNFNSSISEKYEQYDRVKKITKRMRDVAPNSGVYLNEGDVHEVDHQHAFWGPNYPRLLALKRRFDPFGLLDCWQCVGWRGANDSLYTCYI